MSINVEILLLSEMKPSTQSNWLYTFNGFINGSLQRFIRIGEWM